MLETALSGSHCHNTGRLADLHGLAASLSTTPTSSPTTSGSSAPGAAGLRVFVNLLVENRVLCELYPLTPPDHNCDEMVTVRREAQRMRELERYIDAQNGGPGQGWYRIVESPAEARAGDQRRQARGGHGDGGLGALRLPADAARQHADSAPSRSVDAGIDEIYDLGVRQLELVNKFDNALTGVAGDGGTMGTITNGGNFLSAGTFWDLEHCEDAVNHDHSPTAPAAQRRRR